MLDLVIEGAIVVDGSGKMPYRADLGIRGKVIEKIGDLREAQAARRVKADEKVVCPGFVDVHSHADMTHVKENAAELLEPLVRQGITTFVGGNCGMGLAPVTQSNWEGQRLYLETFTQMDFSAGLGWRSMAQFMEVMEGKGLLLNMALLAPHGLMRISAVGMETRLATDKEIAHMRGLLEESLEAGAFGLSTGLQYFPGLASDTRELVEISRPLSKYEAIFTSHLRSYTANTLGKAIDEVAEIARAHDIRGQVSHIFSVPWMGPLHPLGLKVLKWLARNSRISTKMIPRSLVYLEMNHILSRLERHRSSGIALGMDIMPTTAGFTLLLAFFPPWAMQGTKEDILNRASDPAVRAELLEDIEKGRPQWPHRGKNDWSLNIMRQLGWDAVTIMGVGSEKNRHLEGRRFVDIAEEQGKHPFEVMCDLLVEEEGRVLVFESLSEPDDAFTERYTFPALSDDRTMITTDTILMGFGMPSYLFYGCYPKFIQRYVYLYKLVDLPTAIRRCTSLPAEWFGIKRRGLVREGYYADLLLMDPEKFRTQAVFRDPKHYPEGLEMVIINGQPVVDGGELVKGLLAGAMLRKNQQ